LIAPVPRQGKGYNRQLILPLQMVYQGQPDVFLLLRSHPVPSPFGAILQVRLLLGRLALLLGSGVPLAALLGKNSALIALLQESTLGILNENTWSL